MDEKVKRNRRRDLSNTFTEASVMAKALPSRADSREQPKRLH